MENIRSLKEKMVPEKARAMKTLQEFSQAINKRTTRYTSFWKRPFFAPLVALSVFMLVILFAALPTLYGARQQERLWQDIDNLPTISDIDTDFSDAEFAALLKEIEEL